MKKIFLTLMALVLTINMLAQNKITGTIIEKATNETVSLVSIAVSTAKDNKFVTGCVTDSIGNFSLEVNAPGEYIVKVSSIGYKTVTQNVTVKNSDVNMGRMYIVDDAVLLKEVVATGQAAKVVVKEDTFVYNATAYQTPEGSVVEELVKRLPGAQVDESGKITINGKEVKKIKVDGKEFMTGDTETALKNLPTSIIEKVKAYDEKSDQARITGIDDGEEETVLDFGIKKGMNRGTMVNADLAIGTKRRYSERLMGAYMVDNLRVMAFGAANNVGDKGFPGGGGRGFGGGGNNGLNASKMFGLNINYQNAKILTIDGSVRWNHSDGDAWSKSSSENFVSTATSFSNSLQQSYTRGNTWNAQLKLEWNPNEMTNIIFRPSVSLSKNDSHSSSISADFNDDPYKYTDTPLADNGAAQSLKDANIVYNDRTERSLSYTEKNTWKGMAQMTRKFGDNGRNVSLQLNANYSDGESLSSSVDDIMYYLASGGKLDDPDFKRRYNTTPTKNYTYSARATYSEPIAKQLYLQFTYNFKYSKQKSDRTTYSYDDMMSFTSWRPRFRNWQDFLQNVGDPNPLSDIYRDDNLSKYSEYDNYIHEAQVMVRKNSKNLNFSAGVMLQPQHTEFKYKYQGVDVDVSRNVLNFSPSLDFRYKFDKVSQLRATYRGASSQPSMTDLLDIRDDSDPLNIKEGNPGLKPSFTQSFNLRYNTYKQSHMQSFMTFANASITNNSISSRVEFDPATNGRTTRPENINGNWDARLGLMYNAAIDSAGVFNFNTFTNLGYQNHVSNLYQNHQTLKNTTRSTTVSERLSFSYRTALLEIEPNGNISYTHTRNKLQEKSNLDTWAFSYGLNVSLRCPWGTQISTDAGMSSRRGYNEKSMNTNEFLWNAQISQSFLTGKPLTLSLQFYDILHNQSNFSRTISALSRKDVEYNTINSYAMLHVIYRLNAFGGAQNKPQGRPGDDGRQPDFNRDEFRGGGGNGGHGTRAGGMRPPRF